MDAMTVIGMHDISGDGYDHVMVHPDVLREIEENELAMLSRSPSTRVSLSSLMHLKVRGHFVHISDDIPRRVVRFHSPHKPFAKNVEV